MLCTYLRGKGDGSAGHKSGVNADDLSRGVKNPSVQWDEKAWLKICQGYCWENTFSKLLSVYVEDWNVLELYRKTNIMAVQSTEDEKDLYEGRQSGDK